MPLASTHHELDDLGGGRFRSVIHMRAIAHHENGSLVRDVPLWAQGDANFPHVALSGHMLLYWAQGALRICPTRDPLKYFEMGRPLYNPSTWRNLPLALPTRAGNTLTSVNANYDVSAVYGNHFVDCWDMELKNGWTPPNNQLAWKVGLQGLTRRGLVLYDGDTPVGSLRPLVVMDKANPGDVRAIDHQIVPMAGDTYLLGTLPSLAGMSQPVIDPTIALQPGAADGYDCYIQSSAPGGTNATSAVGYVGDASSAASDRIRILIKFVLTGLPSAIVSPAVTFSLRELSAVDQNSVGSWAVNLNRLLRDWVEGQANWTLWKTGSSWATAGAGSAGNDRVADVSASVTLDGVSSNAFVNWAGATLNDDVQKMAAGTYGTYGWIVEAPNAEAQGNAPNVYNAFALSDHATPAYRPTLTVTYQISGTRIFSSPFASPFGGPFA